MGVKKFIDDIPADLRIIIMFLITDPLYHQLFIEALKERIAEDNFNLDFESFADEQLKIFRKYFQLIDANDR